MNYSGVLFDSRLDVFKNDGSIRTASFTVSGSLAGSSTQVWTATPVSIPGADYAIVMFDNSSKHSGSFKSIPLQNGSTLIREVSFNSDLTLLLDMKINDGTITFSGRLINPYSVAVSLQATIINFKYVPYNYTI